MRRAFRALRRSLHSKAAEKARENSGFTGVLRATNGAILVG
jgi:hypothetical protein